MQKLFLFIFVLIGKVSCAQQETIHLGMSLDAFKKMFPGQEGISSRYSAIHKEETTLFGHTATRKYKLYDNRLTEADIHFSLGAISTEQDFGLKKEYDSLATKMVRYYTGLYGKPIKYETETDTFRLHRGPALLVNVYNLSWSAGATTINLQYGLNGYNLKGKKKSESLGTHRSINAKRESNDFYLFAEYRGEGGGLKENFQLGESIPEFAKKHTSYKMPDFKAKVFFNIPSSMCGYDGEWQYQFSNQRLIEYLFACYIEKTKTINDDDVVSQFVRKADENIAAITATQGKLEIRESYDKRNEKGAKAENTGTILLKNRAVWKQSKETHEIDLEVKNATKTEQGHLLYQEHHGVVGTE